MDIWTFIIAAYIVVFIAAFAMTYREQQRNHVKSLLFCSIGYILCTVWPLTIIVVLGAIGHDALTRKVSHS